MKVLYVTTATSNRNYDYIFEQTNGNLNFSIQKFHKQVISGLKDNDCNVSVISGTQISNQNCKKYFFSHSVDIEDSVKYYNSFFVNLPLIKHLCIILFSIFILFKWVIENFKDKDKIIILDAAYVSVNPLIVFFANLFEIKNACIVCDIYDYMSYDVEKNKKRSFLKKIVISLCNYVFKSISLFILLTEQMNSVVNKYNKKYIVMEGIFSKQGASNFHKVNIKDKKKIIMYAGKLYEKYGVKDLIESFKQIKDNDIELHLYGNGDLESYINEMVLDDERIKYFGIVTAEEILKKEQEAFLLVNPRTSEGEYTKYSFPSKTMEYIASGTPVLCYKLEGIPDEYDDHIFYVEKDLKYSIKKILKTEPKELKEKSKKAQNFILKHKNSKVQCSKIKSACNDVLSIKNYTSDNYPKWFQIYLFIYMILNIVLSRNTIYSLTIFNVRNSVALLFVFSIPIIVEYIKKYLNNTYNKQHLNVFIIFITFVVISMLIKWDFALLNFSLLLSVSLAFCFSQLIELKEFKKMYIYILLFLCIFSMFSLYIVKPLLIRLNLFNSISETGFLLRNNIGTPFINMIFSFLIYNPTYIRNFSIFTEPSYFQFYIIVGLIFLLNYDCKNKKLYFIINFILLLTLFTTFSTTGFLACVLFLIAMIIKNKRKLLQNKNKFLFCLLICTIFMAVFLFNNSYIVNNVIDAIKKIFVLNDSSTTRYSGITYSLITFLKNPIVGVNIYSYFSNIIIANSLPSMFAIYGIFTGMIFLYYIYLFSKKNTNSTIILLLVIVSFLLSTNGHIFMFVESFWLILFSGCLGR